MPTLDPTLRCNHCGAKLVDESATVCQTCNSEFAKVSTGSELQAWEQTRKRGRTRFVLTRWTLGFSGILGGTLSLGSWLRGDSWIVFLWIALISLSGGTLAGIWRWKSAEREYAAAQAR